MERQQGTDIRIYRPVVTGKIKHAIFDFDGTISLLREGWERIMEPMMIECICGDHQPTDEVVECVRKYIDDTTGVQTIVQMEGLVNMVREFQLVPEGKVRDALAYKQVYNERLMVPVSARIAKLQSGELQLENVVLSGAVEFCRRLYKMGITMYLASGTDQQDVRYEANILNVAQYFTGGIYGAIGSIEKYSKDKVIREIVQQHGLHGPELIVFGDGPVEISRAKANGAIAVGVASDEVKGYGWNPEKIRRLEKAGCDVMIPDFREGDKLFDYLMHSRSDNS